MNLFEARRAGGYTDFNFEAPDPSQMRLARQEAIDEARAWMSEDFVILDTETTGLDETAEIVEISVIDRQGNALMDTLIKPYAAIPEQARAIHGISNDDVEVAPWWSEVADDFERIINGKRVIIYNAGYDTRIIDQTARLGGVPSPIYESSCAMLTFARFNGEWDDYREKFRWKRLADAAGLCGVEPDGVAHRALTDCRMTLGVIQHMAAQLAQ